MKRVMMFMQLRCPYCRAARGWMDELFAENEAYRAVPLELIDELENPVLAQKYDYYRVPTYYVGGVKMHEGAATKAAVQAVFDCALQD